MPEGAAQRKKPHKKSGSKKSHKKAHKSYKPKTHHKNGSAYTVEQLRARIAKHNKRAAEGKKVKTTRKVKGEHVALRKTALLAAAKKAHVI